MPYQRLIHIDVLSKLYQYQYLNDTLLMMPYRYFIDIDVLSNILSVSMLYRYLKVIDLPFQYLHIDIIVTSAIPYPY